VKVYHEVKGATRKAVGEAADKTREVATKVKSSVKD
jgi:hypothetical protein